MIEQMLANFQAYGVVAVFVWMFMEEFLPFPSVLAPMAAAYVVVTTGEPVQALIQIFVIVAVLGSAGMVLSSYATFGLAYYGGKPGIKKFGKYLGVNWRQIEAFEDHLTSGREYQYVALFRAIPLVPLSLISASSGFFRLNWKKYGIWSFMGMVPRNMLLGTIGWYLADDFTEAATLIGKISTAVAAAIMLVLGLYFFFRRERFMEKYSKGKGLLKI